MVTILELNMKEFYEGMAEILEVEPSEISPNLVLTDENWDSLAIVSTIALVDEVYGVPVNAGNLEACETVGDIERLAGEGKES